jgi:putative ABC transport system permease protein
MFLNYFKLSLRILGRNPFFTVINVVGLAVGITAFYCLWTYSRAELRANQFFQDYERIARVGTHWRYNDNGTDWGKIDFGFSKSNLLPMVHQDFSEMESGVRILSSSGFDDFMVPHSHKLSVAVKNGDAVKFYSENKVIYADSNLFQFFSIPLIRGEAHEVLSREGYVVLSQSKAENYFGLNDPLGQTILLNDSLPLQVSGVFKDLPHHTNFEFDMVISNKAYLKQWEVALFGIVTNFIKVRPGVRFSDFENLMNTKRVKYWSPFLNDTTKINTRMYIQPLQDIPYEAREGDVYYQRSKTLLTVLGVVSFLILIMAWANYINLSIAMAFKRIQEFATRKINGAQIGDLIKQSITEAFLVNVLALLLALTILQLIRKPLHEFFFINRVSPLEVDGGTVLIFGGVFIFGILATGIYPIVFGGFRNQPVAHLKNGGAKKSSRIFLSSLSIFQYSSSIVLILWAYIVYKELNFILSKDYGVDRDGVVLVEAPIKKSKEFLRQVQSLKEKLSSIDGVEKVTLSKFALGDYLAGGRSLRKSPDTNPIGLDPNGVTEDYLDFYKLKILAGRNFRKDESPGKVIVSRRATQRLDFQRPEDAVGSFVETTNNYLNSGDHYRPVEIIGVVEDYRTTDFLRAHASRTDIANEFASRGSVFTYLNSIYTDFLPERIELKVRTESLTSALEEIEEEYTKIFPSSPFIWYPLNDHLNQAYEHEKIGRNQIVLFSLIAIGIACLGLLGNMAHRVSVKTKEIGIRKVLGAGVPHILLILVNSTAFHIAASSMIGIPVAWFIGEQYMARFSERVLFSWWEYFIPLAMMMIILLSSISSILWKAARSNPIEALKYE